MKKKIGALTVIFLFTSLAWIILGGATCNRTNELDSKLRYEVGQLWGTSLKQQAPVSYYYVKTEEYVEKMKGNEKYTEKKVTTERRSLELEATVLDVDIRMDYRKKGLIWYPTYKVDFAGKYTLKNGTDAAKTVYIEYAFPSNEGLYSDFYMDTNGERFKDVKPENGRIIKPVFLEPGQSKTVGIGYKSQGMGEWWYSFGAGVSQIRNFTMKMRTDFDRIDFPEKSISPVSRERSGKGWLLTWSYQTLISGVEIGMAVPEKINPGPFASRVSFFAPVSFFFFLFLMFIITTTRKIEIHPMNYFFIASAFFSFHLLMAYLADHLDIGLTFIICSAVSIFLVVSYMRLVVNLRFSLVEIGLSQFIYLVVFSSAFFLDGYSGLAITILAILTLFVVMQATGKINWSEFEKKTQ